MSCDVGKATEGWRRSCDVGEVTVRLENELSSILRVQIGLGVHATSFKMTTGEFPRGKGGRA